MVADHLRDLTRVRMCTLEQRKVDRHAVGESRVLPDDHVHPECGQGVRQLPPEPVRDLFVALRAVATASPDPAWNRYVPSRTPNIGGTVSEPQPSRACSSRTPNTEQGQPEARPGVRPALPTAPACSGPRGEPPGSGRGSPR